MAKKSKVEEPEADVELEDLDEDAGEETKPAKSKAQEVTFGVADLAAYATQKLKREKPITTRDLRTLIRKMAREDKPRVNREIVAGNRSRYDWTGPDDPEVKAIMKALGAGELEAGKKEALDKLKKDKAAKKAAEGETKAKKGKGKGKKEAPVEDDDEVDINLDED